MTRVQRHRLLSVCAAGLAALVACGDQDVTTLEPNAPEFALTNTPPADLVRAVRELAVQRGIPAMPARPDVPSPAACYG
jgi:hypothetical protein